MPYTLPTRPCSTIQVFKESVRLYKEVFKILIPINIFYCLFFVLPLFAKVPRAMHTHIHWAFATCMFINAIINLVLFAFLLATVHQWMLGKNAFYKEALFLTFRRFPFYLITKILTFFCMAFGFIVFFVPGLILYVCFGFILPSILFDQRKVICALTHGFKLTFDWDRWWQSFIILLSGHAPAALFTIGIYQLFGQHLLSFPTTQHALTMAIIARSMQAIFLFFIIPWIISTLIVQYHNLKNSVRIEEVRIQFFKGCGKASSTTTC